MASFGIVLLILGMSALGVLGDFFLKLAGNGARFMHPGWFVAGIVTYACTAFGWFYAFKHIKMSSLGAIYGASTVILLTLLGYFYFQERLTGWEFLGIGLAIISIVILARFG